LSVDGPKESNPRKQPAGLRLFH